MAHRERLLSTLIDLIRIDSPSGEEDAVDLELSTRLRDLGCQIQHDSFNNIVAKLAGNDDSIRQNPVMLSAHMDTVDTCRGIKPVIDGDSLRSDGTTILGGDCKAGLTIVLEALASVKESGGNRRPVEVAFTRHEEGGLVGAHHLDFGLLSAKEGVVFDGEGPANRITIAAPSQNVVTANIKGRAAHAGLEPEVGRNALSAAATALLQLQAIPRNSQGNTRVNVGMMEGGSGRNIIPDRALLKLETRGETVSLDSYMEGRAREILEASAAMHGVRVNIEKMGQTISGRSDPEMQNLIAEVASDIPDFDDIVLEENFGAGDDAAIMMNRVQQAGGKASYIVLGTELPSGHHTPFFDFNEEVLVSGTKLFVVSKIALSLP